ncbi:MAG: hypothetical protein A2145_04310 [candidate division Zixibacteria bacterium RBG_16_40_9]|nr:MAG: hypothetical protein A2145_04310 [candidate division Zixibacteria bacterium RBG_16_40_9]
MRYSSSYSWGAGVFTPMVKFLLLANLGVFILQQIVGYKLITLFGLAPQLVLKKGYIWQLATYMFLHDPSLIFHILLNMFILWMFGCELERAWGSREFLKYYLICGLGAGVLTVVLSWNSIVPTIGASGAIFGILVAYAMMFPDRLIYVYFLFPVKAKYLVIFFAVIEFLASLRHTSDGIGHFAHLGGMLIGFLYIKADWRTRNLFTFFKNYRYKRMMKQLQKKRAEKERLMEKVDQILDKINRVGIENLTKEEKKILEEASHLLSENQESKIP